MKCHATATFTLLLLVLSGCLPLPYEFDPMERVKEAEEEVERLGGTVVREKNFLPQINLEGCDLSDADWKKLLPLNGLIDLHLSATTFSDEDIHLLRGCPNLERLDLRFTNVTDEGVAKLRKLELEKLEFVLLNGCNVSDACVDDVLAIESLEDATFGQTHITREGFDRLKEKIDVDWLGWSTIPSEEIRQAFVALERNGVNTHSTAHAVQAGKYDQLYRQIDLEPPVGDIDTIVESANRLAADVPLHIRLWGEELLPVVKRISPIDDLFITERFTEERPFDVAALQDLNQVHARRLHADIPDLPISTLRELTNVRGLRQLQLTEQQIDPEKWAALIDAASLEGIEFVDCQFQDIAKFAACKRPIEIEFTSCDDLSDSQKKMIQDRAAPEAN